MATSTNEQPAGSKFALETIAEPGPHDSIAADTLTLTRAISCSGSFTLEHFHAVMLNLIHNPNITSSYLFRADIFYDSEKDASFDPLQTGAPSSFVKHMKAEYRPRMVAVPGWTLDRLLVRDLVPRNPQLDGHLAQTCLIFKADGDEASSKSLVIYVPHVDASEEMPFYHPQVRALGFLYELGHAPTLPNSAPGRFSLLTTLFESNGPDAQQLEPSTRLSRTLLKLLQVIHKHSVGKQAGYQKRMHHDLIVPQKRFQDTYTALKARHAKHLVSNWREVTDPSKHVFEDLGIAAFLIELWKDMYQAKDTAFPGFVDIGCGNGILTYILIMEGYTGCGFDARARNSWAGFPDKVQSQLSEAILVPWLYQEAFQTSVESPGIAERLHMHDGRFTPGTFIISNHADELTVWTPLLASLSQSPFIAVPCCSHNLAGERFRAPNKIMAGGAATNDSPPEGGKGGSSGSLRQTSKGSTPSQYASLCAYVEFIAGKVEFETKREALRIPSTRNTAILGRKGACPGNAYSPARAHEQVMAILEEELRTSVQQSAEAWIERAKGIACSKKAGH